MTEEFVSEVKQIPHNDERIFTMLSDLSNLERIKDRIPQDKIKNFEFDSDTCSFAVDPVGKITFQIVEREPNKLIKFTTTNSPVPLFLWIQLKQVAEDEPLHAQCCTAEQAPPSSGAGGQVTAGADFQQNGTECARTGRQKRPCPGSHKPGHLR